MADYDFDALNSQLERCASTLEKWRLFQEIFRQFGVEGIGYGVIAMSIEAGIYGNMASGFFIHTYGEVYDQLAANRSAVDEDISVDMVLAGEPEIFWHDESVLANATPAQRSAFHLSAKMGMAYGVTLGLGRGRNGVSGTGLGIWVAEVASEAEFLAFWQENRETLWQLARILDEHLRRGGFDVFLKLTPRENDVLRFLASGLRPAEIAVRLSISEKTFEKYVASAKKKLKARTRDHAVAKAIALDLITM